MWITATATPDRLNFVNFKFFGEFSDSDLRYNFLAHKFMVISFSVLRFGGFSSCWADEVVLWFLDARGWFSGGGHVAVTVYICVRIVYHPLRQVVILARSFMGRIGWIPQPARPGCPFFNHYFNYWILGHDNIYFGMGTDSSGVSTKMLTVNCSLKISTYNPTLFFGFHVTSMYVNLMYTEIPIVTGQVNFFLLLNCIHMV
ncbi:hypothetical protein GIB67_022956 [Kingdonia uniflora]|uniref:Uncharacterized protein n=1 Tax=Kingdonia uniflora TaxID=39325 RepID=A0A7J7P2B8_9MAGN|nr:hypothetical protein GIB67_022956 [Kingdonia uniflora]